MEDSLIDFRMPRLVFIVEGDAEQHFINMHLVGYLSQKFPGVGMHAQKITTNRHLNKKGGNVSYALFRNELKRTAAQGNVLITTMLDFFRLPNDFPGYSTDVLTIDVMEDRIRTDCATIIIPQYFRPYIQKHEFEALLFANLNGFSTVLDDSEMKQVKKIVNDCGSPEDIDGGVETAPSKRLQSIFNYKKVADSILVMSDVNIDRLRRSCPRFDEWVGSLEYALANGRFGT